MRRWFLLLLPLLVPSVSMAQDKPKGDSAAVWPPAPDDDVPKKAAAKDKSKKAPDDGKDQEAKDDAAATAKEKSDEPLPHLLDDPDSSTPRPATPEVAEPPEDPCNAPFDECRETCTIDHTNDDTTKVGGGKPLATCLKRCDKAIRTCEERRHLGLTEKGRDEAAP
jgi:hypothetical protein